MIVADGWMKKIFHKYNWLVVYGLWTSPSWAQPVEVISYEEAFSHSSVRFDGADDQAQENMPAADAPSADQADLTDSMDNSTDAAAVIPGSEDSQEADRAAKPKKNRASRPIKQKKTRKTEASAPDVAAKAANNSLEKSVEKSVQNPSESLPNTVKSEATSAQESLASPEVSKAQNTEPPKQTSTNLQAQSTPAPADATLSQGSPESPTPSQESGPIPLASSPAPAISDSASEPSHTSISYLLIGGSIVLIGGLIGWFRIRRSKTTYLADFDLNSEAENSAVTKLNTSSTAHKKPPKAEPISAEPKFSDFSSHSFQPLSMAPSHSASKI